MTKRKPRGKPAGLSPRAADRLKWIKPFLERLADTCNVRASCKFAEISRTVAYKRRGKDADFAALWDGAMEDGIDALEFVARQRATRPDGPSDVLLIFLLKAHRPEKFGDRIRVETTVADVDREALRIAEEMGLDVSEVQAEARRILAGGKGA